MWILGQVFINVGYVVGLLPVTGLQLPLISAGGTSTATTLLMIGVIANAARHEPEAVAALRAGRDDRMNRMLRLPLPQPYAPTRTEALRDRLRSRPAQTRPRRTRPRRRPRHSASRCAGRMSSSGPVRRAAQHSTRQRYASQRDTGRRARALERSSVTGELRRATILGSPRRRRHRGPRRTRDGRRRRPDRARPCGSDVALGTAPWAGNPAGARTRLRLELITPVPLPRKPTGDLLRLPVRCAGRVRQTRAVLDDVGADVVVGFGGYVALPAYLAARRRRVPVVLHEANARAGWANRVGARSFARSSQPSRIRGCAAKPRSLGVPVRAAITSLDRKALRAEARAHFGFPDDARVLLVSAGRRARSRSTVPSPRPLKTLQQPVFRCARVRREEHARPREPAGDPPYVAVPYLNRRPCLRGGRPGHLRSGAMTVAEVTAVGMPAVYVPLPIGNGGSGPTRCRWSTRAAGSWCDADLHTEFRRRHRRRSAHRLLPAAGDDGSRRAGGASRRRPAGRRGRPRRAHVPVTAESAVR